MSNSRHTLYPQQRSYRPRLLSALLAVWVDGVVSFSHSLSRLTPHTPRHDLPHTRLLCSRCIFFLSPHAITSSAESHGLNPSLMAAWWNTDVAGNALVIFTAVWKVHLVLYTCNVAETVLLIHFCALSKTPYKVAIHYAYDARDTAPHHYFGSKWWRTEGIRRAPTDQICLDFLGGLKHGNGYSVAIALPLYEVGCISGPSWIVSERRFFALSSATGSILAYGIQL